MHILFVAEMIQNFAYSSTVSYIQFLLIPCCRCNYCSPFHFRNQDFQEVIIEKQGKPPLRFALAYGFRNIQNIVQRVKRGKCTYHFVEVMACPAGCNNGGGQIRVGADEDQKDRLRSVEEIYKSVPVVSPFQEQRVEQMYSLWLGGRDSKKAQEILHTKYHAIEKSTNALNIKW